MFTRMRAIEGDRGAHGLRGIAVLGLIAGLALSACGGSSSATPTTGPDNSMAPGASSSAAATRGASQAPGDSGAPGGGTGDAAFSAASSALNSLDSYAFKVEIQSSSTTGSVTTVTHNVMTGVVENKPDKASTLMQTELDAGGNVTSSTGIITIGTQAWLQDAANGPWTEVPAAQADIFIQSMAAFRPEQMFGMYFAGIGSDFSSSGTETKNGVAATHYKGDQAIGNLLGSIAGFQGTWSSDVWIANDGGYLVHSEASAQAASGAEGGSFLILVDITKPNSAGPVQ